jgi:hypothetical protein
MGKRLIPGRQQLRGQRQPYPENRIILSGIQLRFITIQRG